MIQVHGKTILSMEFKFMIKAHDLNHGNLFIRNPIFIGNIKAQFSLAISKPMGNIKAQFSLAISKARLMLALLKAQANYLALFYQKPKVINIWQNIIS